MFVLYIFFFGDVTKNTLNLKTHFLTPVYSSSRMEVNLMYMSRLKKNLQKVRSCNFSFITTTPLFFCCCCCLFACLFVSDENCVEVQNSTRQSLIHKNKINILRFHSLKLNFISFIKLKNKKKRNARNQNKTTSPTVIHWN